MLVLDFKYSESISFEKYITPYLKKNYKDYKAETYSQDFQRLDALRKEAVAGVDASLNSVKTCLKYVETLKNVGEVFPIDENNIKLAFPWYNCYPKDKKLVSCMSVKFEMAAVLFNVAIIYWKMAAAQSLESVDSLKLSCNYYMNAAWMFQKLLDDYCGSFSIPASCDLSSSVLITFQKLMLAFAQQCFVQKVMRERGKDSLISKLAASCADFFDASYDTINNTSLTSSFGPAWLADVQAMSLYYFAIAHFRKCKDLLEEKKYGEHISRLSLSMHLFKNAADLGRSLETGVQADIRSNMAQIHSILVGAAKDNDMIYHDPVPEAQKLAQLQRVEMVAPKDPFPDVVIEGVAMFTSVVPLHIEQAMSAFREQKDKILQRIFKDADSLGSDVHQLLHKLGLPAALEAETIKGLPESILKKSEELKKRRAPEDLAGSIEKIKSLSKEANLMISECKAALDAEQEEDDQMRLELGSKWSRPSSSKLNSKMAATLEKYSTAFRDAAASDELLIEKFETIHDDLRLLAAGRNELESRIPGCSTTSVKTANPPADQLKEILDRLEASKATYQGLIQKILDISGNSWKASLQNKDDDPYQFTKQSLEKLEVTKRDIEREAAMQRAILDKIKEANAAFVATKKNTPALQERERILQRLDISFSAYKALAANTLEGIKFYSDLLNLLQKLRRNIDDYTLSRKIEFNDMFRSLQDIMPKSLLNKHFSEKSKAVADKEEKEKEKDQEKDMTDSATVSTFGSIDIYARRRSDANSNYGVPQTNAYTAYYGGAGILEEPSNHPEGDHYGVGGSARETLTHSSHVAAAHRPPSDSDNQATASSVDQYQRANHYQPPPSFSPAQQGYLPPPQQEYATQSQRHHSPNNLEHSAQGSWMPGMPVQYAAPNAPPPPHPRAHGNVPPPPPVLPPRSYPNYPPQDPNQRS